MMHRAADRIREAAGSVAESVRSTVDGTAEKPSEWTAGMSDGKDGSQRGAADKDNGSWAGSARQNAGHVAEDARNAVGSLAASAHRAASETYEGVTETGRKAAASISDSTRAAGRRTLEAGSSIVELCREQPVLTTAIGVALGAFLGALAPWTNVEDRMMGDTSDELKDDVKDIASEQYEKVKQAGETVLSSQENREVGASATQASAGVSVDKPSAGRSDRVTLVPEESTAPGEPYEKPTNVDRSPI